MSCPTVRIASKEDGHNGFIFINEEDFDSKTMKKYVEKKTESDKDAAKEDAPE